MPSEAEIMTEGTIIAVLPGAMFRVELDHKHQVLAHKKRTKMSQSYLAPDSINRD